MTLMMFLILVTILFRVSGVLDFGPAFLVTVTTMVTILIRVSGVLHAGPAFLVTMTTMVTIWF